MIHRLHVEVRIPRACYDAGGDTSALQRLLRAAGVLSPDAQDVRWRLDVEAPGYLLSYTVPVTRQEPPHAQP